MLSTSKWRISRATTDIHHQLNTDNSALTLQISIASSSAPTTPKNAVLAFPKAQAFIRSALAISIALSSSSLLTGCGGSNPATDRIQSDTTAAAASTARTSYNLTLSSPVKLTNVQATVVDVTTGVTLGQAVINGNTATLAIPVAYTSNRLLLATLSPIDGTSSYVDPMLNNGQGGTALFSQSTTNQALHAFITMPSADVSDRVDPFNEMVYQRTLIRSGMLDLTKPPVLSNITADQVTLSFSEMVYAFGIASNSPYATDFNSPADIAKLSLYQAASATNSTQIINQSTIYEFIALTQLALYAQNNPNDAAPYLDFATRASLDMRDGDLDGMTTFGGDSPGTVQIAQPIVYTVPIPTPSPAPAAVTAPINSDPDQNILLTLIGNNKAIRIAYGAALQAAALQYFGNINAISPMNSNLFTVPTAQSIGTGYINLYNFFIYTGASTYGFNYGITINPETYISTTRVGAGNYTLAFGLPSGTNLKTYIDASDDATRSNDIMQLNGVYQSSSGCQLNIGYNGTITLTQGSQSYTAYVNRNYSSSLTRLAGAGVLQTAAAGSTSTYYLLNITTGNLTSPAFIQILTNGAQVLSANEGRSSALIPMTLDTTDLTCTF